MKTLLSIIIPVYNVEKYIVYFADSLFGQLVNDIELIIVVDGSEDNSEFIIRDKIAEYKIKNVNIHKQENKGVSEARNKGLEISRGEYITFIDPDDTVNENYISGITEAIKSGRDIYTFNANRMSEKGDVTSFIRVHEGVFNSNGTNKDQVLSVFELGNWFLWVRVFRKKLFEGVSFPKDCRYEDLLVVPRIYLNAKSRGYINDALINYRSAENSITKNPNHRDVETIIEACRNINDYIKLNDDSIREIKEIYFISLLKTLIFVSIKVFGYKKAYQLVMSLIKEMQPTIKAGLKLNLKNKIIADYTLLYFAVHFLKRY